MDIEGTILLAAFLLCLLLAVSLIVVIFIVSDPKPHIIRYESEKYFISSKGNEKKEPFPSIMDPPTVTLSIIVPAYNEEERLPKMLKECIDYLEERQKKEPSFTYEIVIVDDGSRDRTTGVGLEHSHQYGDEKVRVLSLIANRGKGGAVRLGMLSSRGKNLLFADADGATRFADLEKLEESLKDLSDKTDKVVVIGSRAHLEKESVAERSSFRTFLMYGFHFLVWNFGVQGIKDTQCGFKLLTRSAGRLIFHNLHVERWAFDVEMLYIAKQLNMLISEVAVNWTEIEGSKIVPVWSWLEMARDLLLIWLKYRIGAWRISTRFSSSN